MSADCSAPCDSFRRKACSAYRYCSLSSGIEKIRVMILFASGAFSCPASKKYAISPIKLLSRAQVRIAIRDISNRESTQNNVTTALENVVRTSVDQSRQPSRMLCIALSAISSLFRIRSVRSWTTYRTVDCHGHMRTCERKAIQTAIEPSATRHQVPCAYLFRTSSH